jgi:glycosyltransferase involved in cell wall biosynthesis
MKIVLLNTSDSDGGAARACYRLMEALNSHGHQAVMIVQEKKSSLPNVHRTRNKWYEKPLKFYRSRYDKWLLRILGEKPSGVFSTGLQGIDLTNHPLVKDADIIHLHWINRGMLSVEGIKKLYSLNKPIIWTLHDMWAFTGGCHYSFGCEKFMDKCGKCPVLHSGEDDDLSRKVWLKKESVFPGTDLKVITPSKWLADEAKKSSLFKKKEVINIPNAINTDVFKPTEKEKARHELNLKTDRFIILFGAENSTLDERKGFIYLVEALKYLAEFHPDLSEKTECLVFGSEGDSVTESLPFDIHFAGFLNKEEDLVRHYNAADIFVTPSLQDNLPNTIVESMACGTPCVGFNIGGISDLIVHMKTGYLASPRSVQDLANGIRLMFENTEQRRHMSVASRLKMTESLNYKIIAENHTALYRRVLEQAKKV